MRPGSDAVVNGVVYWIPGEKITLIHTIHDSISSDQVCNVVGASVTGEGNVALTHIINEKRL